MMQVNQASAFKLFLRKHSKILRITESDKFREKRVILNNKSKTESSWLRYVNYACSMKEQNLISVQYKSEMYYITHKAIGGNEQLLLWYQDIYNLENITDIKGKQNLDDKSERSTLNQLPVVGSCLYENGYQISNIKYHCQEEALENNAFNKKFVQSAKMKERISLHTDKKECIFLTYIKLFTLMKSHITVTCAGKNLGSIVC